MPIYNNTQFIFTDTIGITGTTITSNSITTSSINFNYLNSSGSTGYILSNNGTDLQWIEPQSIPTNINMNTNDIINANTISSTNLNTSIINVNNPITNILTFNNPPFSNDPISSTHLATKNYVDINTPPSIFYNLYLNYSQSSIPGYFTLSNNTTSMLNKQKETIITSEGSKLEVCSFISEPLFIATIPACIWSLNIFGSINSITDQINYIADFKLYNNGSIRSIGTSSNSTNHTVLTTSGLPYKFTVNLTLSDPITIIPDDRIIIILNLYKVSGTTTQTVTTYFENPHYSYAELQVSKTINSIPIQPIWAGNAVENLKMNTYNITSSNDLNISCPNNILSLDCSGTNINIGTDTIVPSTINLLSSESTGTIYMHKRAALAYTVMPTIGQIGEIINVSLPDDTLPFEYDTDLLVASTPLNFGVWLVTASSGFLVTSYTAGNSISNITMFIKNGSTLICQQQRNMPMDFINADVFLLHCSGIITTTIQTTITLYQKITFIGGSYKIANSADNFNFNFTRIA
jgi:hypothetical protein